MHGAVVGRLIIPGCNATGEGRLIGQSSLLAFLNERLLSATSGHRIDFKDRALMINKSVALPDQIFARPELA